MRRRFYTTDELAALVNVAPKTIRRWVRIGKIPQHCTFQSCERRPYMINPLAVQFFEDNNRWPTAREFKTLARNRRRQHDGGSDAVL